MFQRHCTKLWSLILFWMVFDTTTDFSKLLFIFLTVYVNTFLKFSLL